MAHMSKKELKRPDEFWQKSRSFVEWLGVHGLQVGISLAVIFIIIIVSVYSNQVAKKKEGMAQYHLSLAKTHFEQWKLEKKDAEKKKSMEALSQELNELQSQYAKSAANHLAMLIRAELAIDQGKWTEVINYYQAYGKFLPEKDRIFGNYPLAKAYEQAGDFTKALEVYEGILKVNGSSYEEGALLGKARTLRLLTRFQEAEATYQEFIDKFPDSSDIGSVRGLIVLTRQISAP